MSEIMDFAPSGPDFGPFSGLSGPVSTMLAYILAVIGLIGLVLLVVGLLRLVAARGDVHKRENAKGDIRSGIIGVAIALLFVFGLSVFEAIGSGVTT